jgi:single-stranded-DNA-specific exonuclease
LQQVAHEWLDAATLSRRLLTDGPLAVEYFNAETVQSLDAQVWGQAFEPPLFSDEVDVVAQRLVGEKHLKLTRAPRGARARRDLVRPREPVPERVTLAYRLVLDEWNGRERVQMVVEGMVDRDPGVTHATLARGVAFVESPRLAARACRFREGSPCR